MTVPDEAVSAAVEAMEDVAFLIDGNLGTVYRRDAIQAALAAAAPFIKAAGLRTITNETELDALSVDSVIVDGYGRVLHRWLLAGWQNAGPTLGTSIAFPVTVLREGKP